MPRTLSISILLVMSVCLIATSSYAQDNQGPIPAPPTFKIKRIPAEPPPGTPPIPAQEIIRRFTAKEDVMKKLYDTYNFTQVIRVEELGDPGGKFTVTGEIYTKPDGSRFFRILKPAESTLKRTDFTLEDVQTMVHIPLFVLTTDEISNYDLTYIGQEKLDQINTFIFRVKPKQVSRTRRFFDGVVWADDQDFAIVKSYGQFVSEISGSGTKLPFKMFEVYRENFQDTYWLPTYIRSDDVISEPNGDDLHLRLVIRDTDFKLNTPSLKPASSSAAGPASPSATPPKAPLSN